MKILIADSSKVGWKRISKILEDSRNVELTGSGGTNLEVVSQIEELKPDVLILDIDIPVKKGIELVRRMCQEYPLLGIIVLTYASSPFLRRSCLEAGARFFFDKATEFSKVPQAIEVLAKDFQPSPEPSISISSQ